MCLWEWLFSIYFLNQKCKSFYQSKNVDAIHVQAPNGTISEPSRRDTKSHRWENIKQSKEGMEREQDGTSWRIKQKAGVGVTTSCNHRGKAWLGKGITFQPGTLPETRSSSKRSSHYPEVRMPFLWLASTSHRNRLWTDRLMRFEIYTGSQTISVPLS